MSLERLTPGRKPEPTIVRATLDDCARAFDVVAEFKEEPDRPVHQPEYLANHLIDKASVICLTARFGAKVAGCVIGYRDPDQPTNFYLWMAGISNNHRQEGLLGALHDQLVREVLAIPESPFDFVTVRTWRKRAGMIASLKKFGYEFLNIEIRESKRPESDRINARLGIKGSWSTDSAAQSWERFTERRAA